MKKIFFLIILIVLLIPVLSFAHEGDVDADHHNGMMGNMMGNWGMGAGWSWFGWVWMVLVLIAVIVGIIALVKYIIK